MFLKLFTDSKKCVHKFLKCSHLLFIFSFFRFQRCSNFKKFVHKFESDHNFQILFTISNNVLVFNFVPFLFTKTVCAFEICSHYQIFCSQNSINVWVFRKCPRISKTSLSKNVHVFCFTFLKFENSSELLIFLIVFWYTARLLKEIHNFEGKFGKIQKKLSTFFIGISSYTSTLHI